MQLPRRRFLLLAGAAVPGLWLAGSGFIEIPKRLVLAFGGRCSFCNRSSRETRAFAGVIGRPLRICTECVALCRELIAEEDLRRAGVLPGPGPSPPPEHVVAERARREIAAGEIDRALEE